MRQHTEGPQPSWWKAGAGILILTAAITFGTLHNIKHSKPEMYAAILEPVLAFLDELQRHTP